LQGAFTATPDLPGVGWDEAVTLKNGQVLLTGGRDENGSASVAAVYDPASGKFHSTGSLTPGAGLTGGRSRPSLTLLPDGRVLVAGGKDDSGRALATAEIYDPATGAFTNTGAMSAGRVDHTATLLRDGTVLLVGGRSGPDAGGTGSGQPDLLSTAEIYDPSVGTFTATGSLATARADAAATLLDDGKVLLAGGVGDTQLASAEIYDPGTRGFSTTASMSVARQQPTATLLATGRVLLDGGWGTEGSLSSAELFDPVSGTFSLTGSMGIGRYRHATQLLSDGLVLVVGGECSGDHCSGQTGPLASSELYDPSTGLFTPAATMGHARYGSVSASLGAGSVLVVGGQGPDGILNSGELYRR
jgi:hypothetical protein